MDLHAHASKRGCFIYGNYLDSREAQMRNRMYVKLIASNSPWFEYKGCDFSLKGMSGKDKRDNGLTKDGSGRVGIFKATQCSHCYTLECNYNEGLATNALPNCKDVGGNVAGVQSVFGESAGDIRANARTTGPLTGGGKYQGNPSRMTTPKYNRGMYCNVGEACAIALLDMSGSNVISRVGGGVPSANPARPTQVLKGGEWEMVVKEVEREVKKQRAVHDEDDEEALGFEERWGIGDKPGGVEVWRWAGELVGEDKDLNLKQVRSGKVPPRKGSASGAAGGECLVFNMGGGMGGGGAGRGARKKRLGRGSIANRVPAAPEREEEKKVKVVPPGAPTAVYRTEQVSKGGRASLNKGGGATVPFVSRFAPKRACCCLFAPVA